MYLSRYSSEHNQKAKCYLFQYLSNKFSNTYSPRKIKRKSLFLLSYLFLCICALQSFVHFQHACIVKSPIFRQEACVVLCYIATQVLSRCPLFRQYPVKMFLLLAGSMLCVISCAQVLSRCCIFRQYPVKMSHLSAVSCQDVPSFGRKHVVCCVMYSNIVKMSHLSAVPCQDVPSFGRKHVCVVSCAQVLSRCCIFRQYPVKMSHLSAGSMLCVVSCTQILSKWHRVLNVIILQVLCWLFPSYTFMSVGAVHRYYVSQRRLFNDSRPGRRESAKKARHNAWKSWE